MPFITDLKNWHLLIIFFWIYLVVFGGKRGRIAAILIIPVLISCDQLSSFIIKPWLIRFRPCYEYENVRLLVDCGGRFSFPSSHATNISGFATLFSIIYPKKWKYFVLIALLIGFSRIYVGKHYPGDIVGGFLFGFLVSLTIFLVYKIISLKFKSLQLTEN
jgi:undecaprenyl-diphosphatase